MAEFHTDDFVWCEDCAHFVLWGIDGEGECAVDGEHTYYGADARDCEYFCEIEGDD